MSGQAFGENVRRQVCCDSKEAYAENSMTQNDMNTAMNTLSLQVQRAGEIQERFEIRLQRILNLASPEPGGDCDRHGSPVPLADEILAMASRLDTILDNFVRMENRIEL
jgi:hypothetical protein